MPKLGDWAHHVGERVLIVKDRATVRYIGNVAGQEGVWVGVEWDDPSRGKHDGSSGGVKYFDCASNIPTAASFVRMEKVNFGTSVLEALTARYHNERGELGDVRESELYVHTVRRNRVQIRVVGEDKIQKQQSHMELMPTARLVGAGVSQVGNHEQLRALVPRLVELDLSHNLISSWQFVEELCDALPSLQVLVLSNNRLLLPKNLSCLSRATTSLATLQALVLNSCNISWQQVMQLQPWLPQLQELHLAGNAISSLAPHEAGPLQQQQAEEEQEGSASSDHGSICVSGFDVLQVLSLEDNCIAEWGEVMRLAYLPSLSRLHLSNNPISDIRINIPCTSATPTDAAPATVNTAAAPAAPAAMAMLSGGGSSHDGATASASTGTGAANAQLPAASGGGTAVPFAQLQALVAASCKLSSWQSVDELDKLPSLWELRLSGNPVLGLSNSGGRFEIIGRVARVTLLNGAEVRLRERRDSELRYVQHVVAELEEAGGGADARAQVSECHPRLQSLVQKYGQVLGTIARSQQGSSMASNLVELKLTCVAAASSAKMGTQVKKLPLSITMSALRLLCEKLFKVKLAHMCLFLRAPGDPLPEEVGQDEDDKALGFFGVQDGYEVLVDEVDPQERQQAAQSAWHAERQAQDARIAQQLRATELLQGEFAKTMGVGLATQNPTAVR